MSTYDEQTAHVWLLFLAETPCHFDLFRTDAFMFHTRLADFPNPLDYFERNKQLHLQPTGE